MTAEYPQNTTPREIISHVITSEDLAKADRKRQRRNLNLLSRLAKGWKTTITGNDGIRYDISRDYLSEASSLPCTHKVEIYLPSDPITPIEWYRINSREIKGVLVTRSLSALGILLPGVTKINFERSQPEWDSVLDTLADKLRTAHHKEKPRRQRF